MREQRKIQGLVGDRKSREGKEVQSSPFREKEELPWAIGGSSELCMVEEYSQTRDV